MKAAAPLIGAGASFASAVIVGLIAGIVLSRIHGNQMWVLTGLFAGFLVGGFAAYRLLLKSL